MEVPIIQKPVHWFVLQTNGLVSISLGPPSRNGSMVMMMMMMMLMTIVMIVVVWDGSNAKTRNYGKAARLCFWLFLLNYCIVNVSFHELLINDNLNQNDFTLQNKFFWNKVKKWSHLWSLSSGISSGTEGNLLATEYLRFIA